MGERKKVWKVGFKVKKKWKWKTRMKEGQWKRRIRKKIIILRIYLNEKERKGKVKKLERTNEKKKISTEKSREKKEGKRGRKIEKITNF